MSRDVPVSIRDEGSKTVVNLETENVDFRNAEPLKTILADLVQEGKKNIVLNLNQVSFMDSSGLGVLLAGKRVTEEFGGSFSICGLQVYVNNLINLTNLHKTIPVYADDVEALKN